MNVKLERWDYYHGYGTIFDSVMPREYHEVDDEFVSRWLEPYAGEGGTFCPDERIMALKKTAPLPPVALRSIYADEPEVQKLLDNLLVPEVRQMLDSEPKDEQEARNREILRCMCLLPTLAASYLNISVGANTLISRGMDAIEKALETYDGREDYDLTAYAIWSARREMLFEVVGAQPHIPSRCSVCLQRYRQQKAFLQELPEEWKPLADNIYGAWLRKMAADQPREMEEFLKTLPEERGEILRLRLGLIDGKCRTLEEMEALTGRKSIQIRTMERTAARLLREFLA